MKILIDIPKSVDRRYILLIGLLLEGLSFTIQGPWSALGSPNYAWSILALLLLGFGSAWAYIPSLPYLIDSVSEDLINYDKEILSNTLSTLMGTTHYLGESVGPIIGGVAAHSFGYENGYAFFGMLILIYFVIYGIVNRDLFSGIKKDSFSSDSRQIEIVEVGEKKEKKEEYEFFEYLDSSKT